MPTVDSAMTTSVVTIAPFETVAAAARMMSDRGVSGLPMVDPDGRVIGIITEANLLHRTRVPDQSRLDDEDVERRRQSATVREVMSHDVVGICPDAPPHRGSPANGERRRQAAGCLWSRFRAEGNRLENRCDSCTRSP